MFFNWLEKKIAKRIAKRILNKIKNKIPELKVTVLEEFEEHKDELLEKCEEVLKDTIKNFVASKINK